MWIIKIFLASLLGYLCVFSDITVAVSTSQNTTSANCSTCYNGTCDEQKSCLLECLLKCEVGYYKITQSSSFVCYIYPLTTTVKTTTTTTTTPTTTTTTTTTPVPVPVITEETTVAVVHPPIEHVVDQTTAKRRRKRQASEETTTSPITVEIITQEATTEATTAETTLPPTTLPPTTFPPTKTAIPKLYCRRCSIQSCSICEENELLEAVCSNCLNGYNPSNDKKSCIKEEDTLSAGAIAGIVIGSVGLFIVVLVSVVLIRRHRNSGNTNGGLPILPHVSSVRNTSNSQAIPKITMEDVQRQHDKVTRYTNDPTAKKPTRTTENNYTEKHELNKLPRAPAPPTSYDVPQTTFQDNPQTYTALEGPKKNSLYVNQRDIENNGNPQESSHTDHIYGNIQQSAHAVNSYSNLLQSNDNIHVQEMQVATNKAGTKGKFPVGASSSVPEEMYEPVGIRPNNEEQKEIYLNKASIAAMMGGNKEGTINEAYDSENMYAN